jgi:sulfate adenylyltransferase
MISSLRMKQQSPHGGTLINLFATGKEHADLSRATLSLPRIYLNSRQLCDLELLMDGAFSPLTGFLDQKDYESVVSSMRLANGILWPIPIVLDVDDITGYKKGMKVVLCDEYGKPLAILTITSIYEPDKRQEARRVYGSVNTDHFGVRYLLHQTGRYYIGGSVTGLSRVDRFDFMNFRKTPRELRRLFSKNKWESVIGFQTRNPVHRIHHAMMKQAALDFHAHVLLHPSVGLTKEGDIDYITRVHSYIALYDRYMKDFAMLSLLPLAMRMGGPREALWHAIIRKNYGCTHFIVGRDHAGPGKDRDGVSYYGPYEAQELVNNYAKELNMTVISYKEMMYLPKMNVYVPEDKVPKRARVQNVSGTKVRELIRSGAHIPEWISYPEVVAELRRGIAKEKKEGVTIFLTGLPCAGKSTIARVLCGRLLEIQDKKVTFLDGDVIRQNLSKGLGFSKEDRNINIKRIGFVAGEVTRHGGIAICSAVAPYEEARQANRERISKYGTYIEVYVSTPLSVCRKRDVKGLYKRGTLGKVKGITGVDDPYEVPKKPELTIRTVHSTPLAAANRILTYLTAQHLIPGTI